MFLLVPALLLAMEAANWSAIAVSPPHLSSAGEETEPPQDVTNVKVMVRADGFVASVGRSGARARSERVVPNHAAELDYDGLAALAQELKQSDPRIEQVSLSAEGDIPLQSLVRTMDALRGESCSLAEGTPQGDCLLWRVEIEA